MQRSVYIAGPMRGFPEFNFPAFDVASALGRALGWYVISPAEMDRAAGMNEKETYVSQFDPEQVRTFIRRDVSALVERLRPEKGDAIALLPGWEKSMGARGELFLAMWHGLKVLDARNFTPLVITPSFNTTEFHGPAERGDGQVPDVPSEFRSCSGGDCGLNPSVENQAYALANGESVECDVGNSCGCVD